MTKPEFVYGVTIDQIDQFNDLIRIITANGDVITVGCEEPLHPQTVSALGESVFNAALALRKLFTQIGKQKLSPRAMGTEAIKPE